MNAFLKHSLAGSFFLLASGCDAFGEFEGPELCRLVASPSFVGGLPASEPLTLHVAERVDLRGQIPRNDRYDFELRFKSATFTVLSGSPDLSFVQSANIEVQAEGAEAGTRLVSYTRDPQSAALSPLTVESVTGEDLLPLAAGGPIDVGLDVVTRPPELTTQVEVKLCFSTHGRLKPSADAGTP